MTKSVPPDELISALTVWWIEGERVLDPAARVDRYAARERYTLDGLASRYPETSRAVRSWFATYVDWAASYAARELDGWLRDALRAGRRSPESVPERVRHDIAAALGAPRERGVFHRHQKFDPAADLDVTVELGRNHLYDNWST